MAYTTIDDPSAHFQTALYSGNGSTQSITNDGNSDLQPDWLWFKSRNSTQVHQLFDTSRGIAKSLRSNGNDAENTDDPNDRLTAINSDGFTLGDDGNPNNGSNTYVCWQWKANGGTTSTNSDGTVDVTIQVNSTAGFSIMKWNGNGNTSGTVGHGLGAKPDFIVEKYGLDGTSNWGVAFPALETSKLLTLNSTSGFATASGLSGYNTTVWTDGNGAATGGTIAYAFKNIQGYSKFGKYTGTGNSDGPFVYTGFKPAWLMIKRKEGSGYWVMLDSKRNTPNGTGKRLGAQATDAEYGSANVDIVSNGFKVRASNSDSDTNLNGDDYVFMAFAEHPFVSSEGVPVTAR